MAKEVANEINIQDDWLNDWIKRFIYTNPPHFE